MIENTKMKRVMKLSLLSLFIFLILTVFNSCAFLKEDTRPLRLISKDLNPSPGEEIEIQYLLGANQRIQIKSIDLWGNSTSFYRKLELGKVAFNVPENACVLFIEVIEDSTVFSDYYFLYAEDGVYLNGTRGLKAALSFSLDESDRNSYLKTEINLHSDLIPLYGIKWFSDIQNFSLQDISKEVSRIGRDTLSNPATYGALASGMAILGEPKRAVEFLDRYLVIANEPDFAPEIFRHIILSNPDYKAPGLLRRGRKIAKLYPASEGAIVYSRLETDSKQQVLFEEIFKAHQNEAANLGVTKAYIEYQLNIMADTILAVNVAEELANSIVLSKPDTMPNDVDSYLVYCQAVMAEALLRKDNFQAALSYVDQALKLTQEPSIEYKLLGIGARCGIGQDDVLLAEDFIKRLLAQGKIRESSDLLQELYPDSPDRDSLLAHYAQVSRAEFTKAPVINFEKQYSRGPKVLFFFRSTSKQCIEESDNLARLVQMITDTNIHFLALTTQGKEELEGFELGQFEICTSMDSAFTDFEISAMPSLYVLDTNNNIRYEYHFGDGNNPSIDVDRISSLLQFLIRRESD